MRRLDRPLAGLGGLALCLASCALGRWGPSPSVHRTFFSYRDRLQEALQRGASSEELVKIALRPVLQSGPNRYKVIDELILLKDEMVRMPPSQTASLIRQLVP